MQKLFARLSRRGEREKGGTQRRRKLKDFDVRATDDTLDRKSQFAA